MAWKYLRLAAAWVWPPSCAGCKTRLPPETRGIVLCPSCYAALPLWRRDEILPPDLGRVIDSYAAPYLYDGLVRNLILRLKFADATILAPLLAQWLRPYIPLEENVVLVPVPAHPKRIRERGYNQTVLLVRTLSRMTGVPYEVEGLKRLVASDGQVARTRKQRLKMRVADFAVAGKLAGQHVVLVDDILTTGGTARACAGALKKAGVARVSVVTVAYTPPASEYVKDDTLNPDQERKWG